MGDAQRMVEIDLEQTEARLRSGNFYGAERMLEIARAHLSVLESDDPLHAAYGKMADRYATELAAARERFEAKRKALRWVENTEGVFERLSALQLPHWNVEISRDSATPLWVTTSDDTIASILTSNGFHQARSNRRLHLMKWKRFKPGDMGRMFDHLEDFALEYGMDPYPGEVVEVRNERTRTIEAEIAAKAQAREAQRPRMADA